MVQEPHTSSRQAASQAGGVVFLPSAVTGLRWICINTEMTLALGRRSTWNSSQRSGWLRRTRTTSLPERPLGSVIVAGVRRPGGGVLAVPLPLIYARAPPRPRAHAVLL